MRLHLVLTHRFSRAQIRPTLSKISSRARPKATSTPFTNLESSAYFCLASARGLEAASDESLFVASPFGYCCDRYQKADGVKQDIPKAIEIFEQAAALGHGIAMNALGVIYVRRV